jgi:hypothetical protein
MGEYMQFVEDFVERMHEDVGLSPLERDFKYMGREDGEDYRIDVALSLAWQWHNEMSEMTLNDKKREMTGLYAQSYLFSWTGFCKLYHLSVLYDAEQYEMLSQRRGRDFPYFAMIQKEANGTISPLPISQYKMTQVWDSMRQILPTLYIHTYSQDMRDYVNALFFRYCSFFCEVQKDLAKVLDNPLFVYKVVNRRPTNDEDMVIQDSDDSDGSDDDGGEGEEEDYDSYRKVKIPINEQYGLQSEYFYEGELLFFSQLRRMRLSKRLELNYSKNPIILRQKPTKDVMIKTNTTVLEMLCRVCEHNYLRQFVVEDFKILMMSLHVYHGETERYRRKNPTANYGPEDVLSVCRPADHLNANGMHKMKLSEIVTNNHEKEIVLITKCVTHRWLCYHSSNIISRFNNDSKYELQGFVIEEMVSLDYINELITDNEEGSDKMYPTLLKLVRIYYVLDGKGGVYKSVLFVDAYMVWLNLLVREDMVKKGLLYPSICKFLDYFIPF